MRYRLIAADVDGTLLNARKELTPAVAEAIARARAAGAVFTLATGRPYQGVARFLPLLGGDVPLILYNGAVVTTARTRRQLFHRTMPPAAALRLMEEGLRRGAAVVVWCRERLYIGQPAALSADYAGKSGVAALPLADPAALAEAGVTKLIWIADPERTAAYRAQMEAFPTEGVCACLSEPTYLEFMAAGVSKAAGLAAAAAALGIPREETLALGDGENDLSMLRWAGMGVAMGSAPALVRAEADYVTASSEQDGLALALEDLLL